MTDNDLRESMAAYYRAECHEAVDNRERVREAVRKAADGQKNLPAD